ncbi:hypothetical protein JT05_11015 [Desulfosporosinus sp. Tol-M]|nr:hypothetical protein JT05_11015 [Desulfosporosinus sp. Tol-M]
MKKSKVIIVFAVVLITVLTTGTIVAAGNFTLSQKLAQIAKMKNDFDSEHDKLIKGNVPISEAEINENAAAGDNLKEKGIEIQKREKEIAEQQGNTVPTKDKVLSQINLGIQVTEQCLEDFIKVNPNKSKSECLNRRGESNLDRLDSLKKLKDDLTNDKISTNDAWSKVLEIRNGKNQ